MKSVLFKRITMVLAFAASLGLVACSDDDDDGGCGAAVNKLEQCGFELGGEKVTCDTAEDKCVASCVTKSSCEDLEEAFSSGTGSAVECMNACE
jgi:hypothetical protein